MSLKDIHVLLRMHIPLLLHLAHGVTFVWKLLHGCKYMNTLPNSETSFSWTKQVCFGTHWKLFSCMEGCSYLPAGTVDIYYPEKDM